VRRSKRLAFDGLQRGHQQIPAASSKLIASGSLPTISPSKMARGPVSVAPRSNASPAHDGYHLLSMRPRGTGHDAAGAAPQDGYCGSTSTRTSSSRTDVLAGVACFSDFLRLYYPVHEMSTAATLALAEWITSVERVQPERARLKSLEGDARLIESLDTDGSGTICLAEFIGLSDKMKLPRSEMRVAFRDKDISNSGELSVAQTGAVIKELRHRQMERRGEVSHVEPSYQGTAGGTRVPRNGVRMRTSSAAGDPVIRDAAVARSFGGVGK